MNNDLDERLATSLRTQALRSGKFTGLERSSYQRARRIRARRRIVTGIACVVALAIAIPVGIRSLPGKKTSQSPNVVTSPTPSTSRPASLGLHKVTIDLTKLKRGADPRLPWHADGVIHNGRIDTPVHLKGDEAIIGFWPLDRGGYLLELDVAGKALTGRIVNADGSPRGKDFELGDNRPPIVSDDGKRIAWTGTNEAVVANSDGAGLERFPNGASRRSVVGFLGKRLAFNTGRPDFEHYLPAGDPKVVPGMTAESSDGKDIVAGGTGTVDDPCLAVYSVSKVKRLWSDCKFAGGSPQLSHDGQLIGVHPRAAMDPFAKNHLWWYVVDTATGKPLLEVSYNGHDGPNIQTINGYFEPDGNLLIRMVETSKRGALVRCVITTGRCELASDITTGEARPPRLPFS